MPGEPWHDFLAEAQRVTLDTIVCLTSEQEIRRKSPPYAEARADHALPCGVENFPIPDLGAPSAAERPAFRTLVVKIADKLRSGEKCLIHCGAGVGRTGTVATCVLLQLGINSDEANRTVERARSHAEVPEQHSLITWYSTLADEQ